MVVEFLDFECFFCECFNLMFEQVKEKYKDQVWIVFCQFFLNSIYLKVQKVVEVLFCVFDQGKFWEMYDLFFVEQKDFDVDQIKEKVGCFGFDVGNFDVCFDNGKYEEQVVCDIWEGFVVGVIGMLLFFVNGCFFEGVVVFELIVEVIDDEFR